MSQIRYCGMCKRNRIFAFVTLATFAAMTAHAGPWERHTIDNTAAGADGARLADYNGDGWLDIVTPFEEGGVVRAFIHPGPEKARKPWPMLPVGEIASGEDAVFADLDGDGAMDVVTCAEGSTRAVYIHWNKGDDAFGAAELPSSKGVQWMFALPLDVNEDGRLDIVAGAKNNNAHMGWFEAPEDAHDLDAWNWHPWRSVGWIMSIELEDMDGDDVLDVVFSDRRGEMQGIFYVIAKTGSVHQVLGPDAEYMFIDVTDIDGDGQPDLAAATRGGPVHLFMGKLWHTHETIAMPKNTGTGKSVRAADIDQDGAVELVISCENSEGKHGVFYVDRDGGPLHEISGITGTKFDLIQLYDVDGDGDLDAITCEERENLGLIWYENPTR